MDVWLNGPIIMTHMLQMTIYLPELLNINTGSNMTVFFTTDGCGLPTSDAPYMVATTSSGLYVEVDLLLQKI